MGDGIISINAAQCDNGLWEKGLLTLHMGDGVISINAAQCDNGLWEKGSLMLHMGEWIVRELVYKRCSM